MNNVQCINRFNVEQRYIVVDVGNKNIDFPQQKTPKSKESREKADVKKAGKRKKSNDQQKKRSVNLHKLNFPL